MGVHCLHQVNYAGALAVVKEHLAVLDLLLDGFLECLLLVAEVLDNFYLHSFAADRVVGHIDFEIGYKILDVLLFL